MCTCSSYRSGIICTCSPAALGRARMLLPQLAAAESQLQEMVDSGSPCAVDIENVSEDEPHISMVII